jgi:hypothetical protein
MTTERGVRLLAGSLVALSLLLGQFISPVWHLLAAFVALNLMQSAFTGFCPAEKILRCLGTTDGDHALPVHR